MTSVTYLVRWAGSAKRAEKKMNDRDAPEEFAKRYTAAWCSKDPASVAAFFAADGSLKVNDADPAVGTAAITEVARGFMTSFPDLELRMDALEPRGDRLLYHWTLIGTNNGPGGTGQKVCISGYEEWQLKWCC
jgi:hypothetical protein